MLDDEKARWHHDRAEAILEELIDEAQAEVRREGGELASRQIKAVLVVLARRLARLEEAP